MRFLDRRGVAARGFAVLVAAYCGLASGRALVPGLCATLADLKADTAVSCHTPEPACCHTSPEGTRVAITHAAHDCAFCLLVHAGVPLEPVPALHASVFRVPLLLAVHDEYVPDSTGAEACMRRGPPFS